MNDETKSKMMRWMMHFWYIIVIVALAIGLLIYRQKQISTAADLETARRQAGAASTIAENDKKLDEMKRREAELYPKLQESFDKLKQAKKALDAASAKIVEVKRETIKNEIDKKDLLGVSADLQHFGYPNTIVSR